MTALSEWENFYVIVGSSAGALIGLQFVVMTLIADKQVATSQALGSTFGTPNIIHFSAALLLSALVSAPWHGIGAVAVLLDLVGLSGLIYRHCGLAPAEPDGIQSCVRGMVISCS